MRLGERIRRWGLVEKSRDSARFLSLPPLHRCGTILVKRFTHTNTGRPPR
jgi:hypothetical protein